MIIDKIEKAISDLKKGKFIMIYDADGREGETDFVMAAEFVTPQAIKRMRKDGGGLIFLMISKQIADKLKLPFLAEMYKNIDDRYPILKELYPNDIPYDTKSSFSLSINHRKTFTGITDIDRALTMQRFATLAKEASEIDNTEATRLFGKEFRSPGHVPICIAAENLLDERCGHTELVIAMLNMANLIPVGSGCEILADDGKALSKESAKRYAKKNGIVFLEGEEIVEVWKKWSK